MKPGITPYRTSSDYYERLYTNGNVPHPSKNSYLIVLEGPRLRAQTAADGSQTFSSSDIDLLWRFSSSSRWVPMGVRAKRSCFRRDIQCIRYNIS